MLGVSTTAPAPSPNNTQVLRSSQFVTDESRSAPMTRAFLQVPVAMALFAIESPYRKPEHPADTSKATALLALSAFCTKHAAEGN